MPFFFFFFFWQTILLTIITTRQHWIIHVVCLGLTTFKHDLRITWHMGAGCTESKYWYIICTIFQMNGNWQVIFICLTILHNTIHVPTTKNISLLCSHVCSLTLIGPFDLCCLWCEPSLFWPDVSVLQKPQNLLIKLNGAWCELL